MSRRMNHLFYADTRENEVNSIVIVAASQTMCPHLETRVMGMDKWNTYNRFQKISFVRSGGL